MFNDINRMEIFLQELLGQCHGATSFCCSAGALQRPKR